MEREGEDTERDRDREPTSTELKKNIKEEKLKKKESLSPPLELKSELATFYGYPNRKMKNLPKNCF